MQRTTRVFALLLALPGLAAPFLPFAENISPLDTIPGIWKENVWPLSLLGAPFFLAIPIAYWQMRRLLADRISSLDIAATYVFSAGAVISILAYTILQLTDEMLLFPQGFEVIATLVTCWMLILANILLLARNVSWHMGRELSAEIFLLGSYLPNAVFCLIAFGMMNPWVKLQIGAWVAAITCLACVVSIVLALRTKVAA